MLRGNHTLVYEHVHRTYSIILGLQFACTQYKFGVCPSHAHVHLKIVVHMSSAYTRALNDRFDFINLVCTRMLARM